MSVDLAHVHGMYDILFVSRLCLEFSCYLCIIDGYSRGIRAAGTEERVERVQAQRGR